MEFRHARPALDFTIPAPARRAAVVLLAWTLSLAVIPAAGVVFAQEDSPLMAGTYLGGADSDGFYEVPAVRDAQGNVFVASLTRSADLPVPAGAYQPEPGGMSDILVAKFDPDMTTLLAATYLGGVYEDVVWPGVALALAADGGVFVATGTTGRDLPTTPDAFCTAWQGGRDIWLARLSAGLDSLVAATYIGGTRNDEYPLLVVDGQGRPYLAASTLSGEFPVTPGGYDTIANGARDLGVCRLDPLLTTVECGTRYGGSNEDYAEQLAFDGQGRLVLAGWTKSINLPVPPDAWDTVANGNFDAFAVILSADLSSLEAATYIGGGDWDFGYGMVVDPAGPIYVGGHTASTDFPATAGAYDQTYSGDGSADVGDDAWVARFSADLKTLDAATYLGGAAWENAEAMALDGDGTVIVAGNSSSANFPTTADAYRQTYAGGSKYVGDIFITRLSPMLDSLRASTFFGGASMDNLGSLTLLPDETLLMAGSTGSADFPVPAGAWDDSYAGGVFAWGGDIWLSKLHSGLSWGVVPNFLQEFAAFRGAEACRICWRLGEQVPADHLRLVVREPGGERELTVIPGAGGAYEAVDGGEAGAATQYELYLKNGADGWLLIGTLRAPETPSLERTGLSAWPNPFNPRVEIRFTLERGGPVGLYVTDLAGRRVATLAAGKRVAGSHGVVWDGTDARGRGAASGAYLLSLVTTERVFTRKVTLSR